MATAGIGDRGEAGKAVADHLAGRVEAASGEAGDGMSGLRVAADLKPDVVLLDVELPDIDGFDVAARLATGEGPQVVLISSREFSGTEQVLRSGARGFVPKDELSGEALAAVLR